MAHAESSQLELLAEVDAFSETLARWTESAPDWQPARTCRALARRVVQRLRGMRIRLEAPLVVATLGGTGVGKSALVNALVGAEVVETGRSRPTTVQPALICRPDLSPKLLGIEPASVRLVQRDLPSLASLVIVDCPDPDTTEAQDAAGTNLARLRQILPQCDVLLVATTQQKYRSAKVAEELAAAAPGARLVFVQTHADTDQDIRDDWRRVLEPNYSAGQMFFVDSLAAFQDAREGVEPRGEFGALVDLLTRQLAGTAAARIRRANLLDLVDDSLAACEQRVEAALPPVEQLQEAIQQQRSRLGSQLAGRVRSELLGSRRQWESRLIGQVASRWGFSPFVLVLRAYQGLGGLISGAVLLRARTPAQVAVWGLMEGARTVQNVRKRREAESLAARVAATSWNEADLRGAALVVEGYAVDAGLDRKAANAETVTAEAGQAAEGFLGSVAVELESLLGRVAGRHTGWFTRWRYELLLLAMLAIVLVRPAKNFFYDSWLAPQPVEIYGLSFYAISALWLLAWCVLLLWAFTSRLRRGLKREIDRLAEGWTGPKPAAGVFRRLEDECGRIQEFRDELTRLRERVAGLKRRLIEPDAALGHRRS